MGKVKYAPPQRICSEHILENFDCGEEHLNDLLLLMKAISEVRASLPTDM